MSLFYLLCKTNYVCIIITVFDAETKIPSGILEGDFFDLGNFNECLGVNNGEIIGKYCLGQYSLPNINQSFSLV